jgi:hypothetical protein
MTIGIVIPVHERADQLALLLQALESQSSQDFHVVVADDGSGPEVAELVSERAAAPGWSGRLTRVACGPRTGLRIGRARNIGSANLPPHVTTLYFLDADMVPQPDAVERVAAVSKDHPGQVIYGPVDWLPELPADEIAAHIAQGPLDELRQQVPETVPGTLPAQVSGTIVGHDIRFSLFGPKGPKDFGQELPVRPYWSQATNCALPLDLFWQLGGFDERVTGRGTPELAFGAKLAHARVTCVGEPDLWCLHAWHPADPGPAEPPGFDMDDALEEYGMPAGIFVRCLGGAVAGLGA